MTMCARHKETDDKPLALPCLQRRHLKHHKEVVLMCHFVPVKRDCLTMLIVMSLGMETGKVHLRMGIASSRMFKQGVCHACDTLHKSHMRCRPLNAVASDCFPRHLDAVVEDNLLEGLVQSARAEVHVASFQALSADFSSGKSMC